MTITTQSILASVSPEGKRIDTLLLRYPRFIHAEFMTHRQFSRNASSSRAIPIERLIEDVELDPAMPVFWGKNQKGMQARKELEEIKRVEATVRWIRACEDAVFNARLMADTGAHKQIVNRLLEPFAHINVVVTATEWDNFFSLRDHDDAQPEIRELAQVMKTAMDGAQVQDIGYGQWHLPFVSSKEIKKHGGLNDPFGNLRAVSSARCARTSYLTHDGQKSTLAEDMALGGRLTKSRPFHASPFEHQAMPDICVKKDDMSFLEYNQPESHRNFVGWMQNRAFMEREYE